MSYISENAFPTLAAAVEEFKKISHYMDGNGYLIEGFGGGERVHARNIQAHDIVGLNVYDKGGYYWYEIVPAFVGTNAEWQDVEESADYATHSFMGVDWYDPDWIETLR